jgi:tRNA(Arg) A34 adenosine deaminase TadA
MLYELFNVAAKIAVPELNDTRNFWLGCVGVRKDGAVVSSKNGAVLSTAVANYHLLPSSHAECRALRKMDYGGILYVTRIARRDRLFAMAKPCFMCQIKIRAKNIKKVYYTINNYKFGVWDVKKDIFKEYYF